MNILDYVGERFGMFPEEIFVLAHQYNEVRRSAAQMMIDYNSMLVKKLVPLFVQDYALDILNGKISPIHTIRTRMKGEAI
jgi:hypothetical protein